MRKQLFLCVVIFFLLLPTAILSGEIFSLDFNTGAKKVVPRTNEISKKVDVPGQNVQGYKFSWNTDQSSYIEMAFNKPIKLPEFRSAKVRAKVWAPVGTSVRSLNVRLRDKDGEIFQFRKNCSFSQGGFFDVEWQITPYNAEGSWGSKTPNKKIDMPADLITMVVSFRSEISSGLIYLLDLSVEPFFNQKEVEASRPICVPDDSSLIRNLWGVGDFSVEDRVINFRDVKSQFGVLERKFEIIRYEQPPIKLVFDTELLEGKASLSANFVFADKAIQKDHPKNFKIQSTEIKPGRTKTVLEIGDLMKDAVHAVRLQRFDLIPKGKKPVHLKIHGIEVVTQESAGDAVDFDIVTDHRIPVLSVGAEDQLKFRFTNRANKDGEFQIDMEYENYFGEKRTERFDLGLASGKGIDITPKWRPDSLGHWTVNALIRKKGAGSGEYTIKSRSLAWIKPAGPTPGRSSGFLFSVCTHTERWSPLDRQLEIEAAALCGVKVARVGGFGWANAESEKGTWKWTMGDELVKNYGKNGIEAQIILWGIPKWASPDAIVKDKTKTPAKNFPADINDWRNYIRKIGTHFKGKIRYYEVWNEPDLKGFSEMSLDQYVALQKAAYEEMKKVDPNAIVMTGGFATLTPHPGLHYQNFQRDYLLAARDYFKIHLTHEHGWFNGYKKRIDELFIPLRKETNTTVPWYSNETAMTSVGGLEKRQAKTLFKKLLFAWIRGSIGYTWYDLRNDGYDPAYGEHHFGMITNDFYPKEVYSVYNMLTTHYSNMKAIKDYSQREGINIYGFGDGKTLLLPGWIDSNFGESHQMIVQTDAKSAKIIDLMGNEKPVEIHHSIVVYEIGSDPRTLKLENGTKGEPIGELLIVKENKEMVPGRKWILSLIATNPINRDLLFDLSSGDLPSGLKIVGDPTQKISVPALEKKNITFEFDVAKDFNKNMVLPLNYSLEGTAWKGMIYVPMAHAIWIGSAWDPQKPNFILDKRNQITSTTPADPSNAHRLWQDPKDLSANVWIAGKGDQLLMKYEIEDDKETFADRSDLEKGDQVRFLFQSEGSDDFSEIALRKEKEGKSLVSLIRSSGKKISQESLDRSGKLDIRRKGSKTIYELSIPFAAIGLSKDQIFEQGMRFDLLIGDDDGEGLDSWLHIMPDHPNQENMKKAPLLFFEKE